MAEGKHFAKPAEQEAPQVSQTGSFEPIPEGGKAGKIALIVIGSLVGALLVIYLGGALFFSRFFLPGTTVNGRDVSFKSAWSLNDELVDTVADYALNITGDGLNLSVKGSDVGVQFDTQAVTEEMMSQQNPWTWPAQLFSNHSLTYVPKATFDTTRLAALVEPAVAAVNTQVTESRNAFVGYNEQTQAFEIVKEVFGSAVNAAKVTEAATQAIVGLEPQLVLGEQFQTPPAVLSDDPRLTQQLNTANNVLHSSIDIMMGGVVLTTVRGIDMVGWIVPNPETFTVDFDEEALRAWGNAEFATKYDTAGTTRTYQRPDGKVVTVTGGTFGWVLDSAELVDQLIGLVKVGSTEPMVAPTKQEGEIFAGLGQKDWGNSWVDVDISEQYARYYDAAGALVWESEIVTGDASLKHDTPEGVYFIHDMVRDTVLVGQTDPKTGEPEYRSPVSYWMPFKSGNWGLHDAPWRSSFGGTIYQGNGSHGCVNLPVEAAGALFGLVHVGTVVVVHY